MDVQQPPRSLQADMALKDRTFSLARDSKILFLTAKSAIPSVTCLASNHRSPSRWRERHWKGFRVLILTHALRQQRAYYSSASASFMAHDLRAEETQGNQAPVPARIETSLSGNSAFEYSPFEDNFSVRILTLAPGTGDDALVGSLSVENLDVNPRYEAISYVWGTEGRCAGILCNGRPLPLTTSIEGALRRLRHATQPRRLWADQICINQDDIAERSRQVSLMNSIYKGAEHVLVWLGPDDERVADDAVSMIHHLRDVFADDELHESFRLAHSEELLQQDQSLWVPLSKLTKLPWVS